MTERRFSADLREPLLVNDGTETNSQANPNLAYAVKIVHSVCCLAGSQSYIDDVRANLSDRGIIRAIRDHDTPALFDWLIEDLSFQGISDAVASGYIAEHGSVRWSEIADALSATPSCPNSMGIGGSTTAGTIRGPIRVRAGPN